MSTSDSSPTPVSFPCNSLTLAAHLYQPSPSAPSRHNAAILIAHPMTGVKEQTSATHARVLAAAGFTCLTFDAAHQGESSGLPRGLENPYQRAEDIKAGISYLTTLPSIDPSRIGVLGICAAGGYATFAAQTDRRIRSLATVSAACMGRITRCGGEEEVKAGRDDEAAISAALGAGNAWRTAHAREPTAAEPAVYFEADPEKLTREKVGDFLAEAAEYYGTGRGAHERSDQRLQMSGLDGMVSYDSFAFVRLLRERHVLMVVGERASTRHFSEGVVRELEGLRRERGGSGKGEGSSEAFVVKGKSHVGLYDDLSVSGPKLVEFFAGALGR